MATSQKNSLKVDKLLFWPPLALVSLLCAYLVINPDAANANINKAFGFLTGDLGWTYQLFIIGSFVLFLYLAFGKYANKRFGDEEPEFSTLTWLGMICTACSSAAILYWGTIEFYFYLSAPPFGAEPFSYHAYEWASSYGLFHWGFTIWALYAALGVVFAYIFYVKKKNVFRPSTACESVIGRHAKGSVGKAIDIFFMIGLIAGVGTSVGLATPLVGELINMVFGLEHTLALDAVVIVIWTAMFAATVFFGLQKGISLLSNIRVYLSIAFLAFIVIVGPRSFMFNNTVDGIGHVLQNCIKMSFYTDPHLKSGFPQGWTIFYWAWFIAFALNFGIYLARISKGRTVREYAIGAWLTGTVGSWIFFGLLGNYAMDVHTKGIVDIAGVMAASGTPRAIAEIWSTFPLSSIVMPLLLILTFLSTATVLNGVAYTLAMVTTKELGANEEPAKWNRVFWAVVLGAVSLTLIFLGGLKPLQTSAILGSFPTMFIVIMIVIGFLKDIRKSWGENDQTDNNVSQEIKSSNKIAG